ncbi:uncharacterized protein BXZ73DRAFT_96792 [Epithele typhae]|uniref:uncharacterized protein n=1 Tax=Epithele typhae TaxID=378194 RepID=UPI0020078147|nr:uncharacterized protein BXZ73DRAFT_96792 [Epithele typhae]KAH9944302.1 hypothetical protein BXZ73DRAFT_96792 [Epithele typhae]
MADAPDSSSSGTPPKLLSFEPKPAVSYGFAAGVQGAGVGALVSAVQNALGKHSSGAAGFLTRTGGTIAFFAAMGATYATTESFVANAREVDDPLNGAAGACAAGFLAGLRARSLPVALASCAVLGTAIGTVDYVGQNASSEQALSKEERRKRFFKQPPPSPIPSE